MSKWQRVPANGPNDRINLARVKYPTLTQVDHEAQPVTASAREQFASGIQHGDPVTTVSAVGPDRTDKPRPATTKVALLAAALLLPILRWVCSYIWRGTAAGRCGCINTGRLFERTKRVCLGYRRVGLQRSTGAGRHLIWKPPPAQTYLMQILACTVVQEATG